MTGSYDGVPWLASCHAETKGPWNHRKQNNKRVGAHSKKSNTPQKHNVIQDVAASEHLMKALAGHLLWIIGKEWRQTGKERLRYSITERHYSDRQRLVLEESETHHEYGFQASFVRSSTDTDRYFRPETSKVWALPLPLQKKKNITTGPTHLPRDRLNLSLDSGSNSFPLSKMAALLPWRWFVGLEQLPTTP